MDIEMSNGARDPKTDYAVCRKSDPEKVKIALQLRRENIMTLKWIAQRLQMGSWANVSNCLANKSK